MTIRLQQLIPEYRTRDVFPDTQIHGETVLAWDEPSKQFVETAPEVVRSDIKRFRFWHPDRRKVKR